MTSMSLANATVPTPSSIEDRLGDSWWDALSVSAALQSRCEALLTEDLQDGVRIDGLEVVNPFLRAIEPLGLGPPLM